MCVCVCACACCLVTVALGGHQTVQRRQPAARDRRSVPQSPESPFKTADENTSSTGTQHANIVGFLGGQAAQSKRSFSLKVSNPVAREICNSQLLSAFVFSLALLIFIQLGLRQVRAGHSHRARDPGTPWLLLDL